MKHQISDLIDLPALQTLMESFYKATGIKHALIDNESRVLTAVGWERACTDFHRQNPRSCERCFQSDRYILAHLHEGPYVGYNCPNGLVDYATPVIIGGKHLANIFTGQILHEKPDLEFFRRQAEEFGYDEDAYLAAIQEVPIVPRERMPDIMTFLVGLAQMLAQQGLTRLQLRASEKEQLRLNRELSRRIRESEERYRLLLEHSPVGILYYDRELIVSYCNHRFAEIMKAPHESFLGLDCKKLRDQTVMSILWKALDGESVHYEGPYLSTHARLELAIEMSCAPFRDDGGEIVGGIAIVQDITERRLKDRQLELYRDHLEEVVAQRTADLVSARAEAERLARVKSEFLANMSHEIRTPLNGVLGMAQIGYRESEEFSKSRETFARILNSGKLLLGIINDVLDISKIEAGKLTLEPTDFELDHVIGNVWDLMAPKAQAKGLELHTELDPALGSQWRGDALRLGQILLNFVSNAIKFTEQGSVTIRARSLGAVDGDILVGFEVQDTGIGIPAEVQPRLFEAFEQADGSITRKYGGTGLGLTISRRLAQLMGGEVGVESEPGKGSTFWFTSRLTRVVAAPAQPAGQDADPEEALRRNHQGARILLAEDEPINRMIVQDLLEDLGLQVDVAENGAMAVRMASQTPYGLILMDMQMPEMDGLEATRNIRSLPGGRLIPIIATTANAFSEDRERCLEAGMNDHIPKPIEPAELFAAVGYWLSRHSQGG